MAVRSEVASALTDLLFEDPAVGRCLVAPDGSVLRANSEWLRSTGFKLDDVLGADIVDLFPETRDMALAMHARARRGRRVEVPRHAQAVNGRETWWEGHIAPVPMENGTGLLITAREVTAEPRSSAPDHAELPPRRIHQRETEILESISEALVVLDRQWRYTYVNRRAAELLGKSVDDLLGQCPWDLFPVTVDGESYRECHRAVAEQVPLQFETFVPTVGRWYENRLFPSKHGLTIYWSDITDRKHAKEVLEAAKERTAYDLDAMTRLHELSNRFVRAGELTPVLHQIVDAAIAITHADMGNIQLLDPASGRLKVAAYRGHEQWWLDFFESVPEGKGASCGTALEAGTRIIVEDVTTSPVFVGTPALEVQLRAGVRAVQSTPLVGSSGELVGMISTHYRSPRRPDDRDLRLLDLLARQAGDMIERRGIDEALRGTEQRFRALADSMPQLAWTAQPDGYITWYNRRWYEFTGTTPEQMEGWGWQSVHDPAALPDVLRRWKESIATGSVFEMEFPLRGADGKFRRFLTRVSPLKDSRGTVTQWFGTNTDVTGLVEARESLAVVTRLYAVLSRVNEAIVRTRDEQALYAEVCRIVAEDGRFPLVWVGIVNEHEIVPAASWGPAAEYLREIKVEIAGELGQGPTGTCVREARPVINDDFGVNPSTWPWREATLKHGLRASAAFPLHRRGSVIGALTFYAASPGAFTAEQVKLLEALCADVSYALDAMQHERLRTDAERALRESEERFRALVKASSDVVYRMSPDWSEMRQLRGRGFIADTEAPSRTWLQEYIHPDDQSHVMSVINEAIRTKGTFQLEHRVLRVDGSVGWTFSRAIPLQDANGEIIEWFGAASDVSERKLAEEELREADRHKDEFLGMLSHELRNPLAPIRNSVYILKHASPAGEQAERARNVIERQAEHLTRLVDDLLDVTRISRGKIELRRSRVDLREVVRRAADDFRTMMDDRGLAFHLASPPAKVWAEADATRLTQLVGNLLHNAAKFTNRGGEVTLSLREVGGGHAEISVRDAGAGIDPALLPTIFEAFVQGERTLARTEGGLGLGLALVKGIAEMHGGTVRAGSAGVGKGAEFVVRLPLARAVEAKDQQGCAAVSSGTRGRRVLVVDDNCDAAESLAEIVELLGHTAEVAYDGPSAVAKARAKPPEFVLCDIGLPGMSGYEVAKALRATATNSMRIIAVSGYAQPEDVQSAAEAGFDAHIAKPVSVDELISVFVKDR